MARRKKNTLSWNDLQDLPVTDDDPEPLPKCKPHHWRIPTPGDEYLECEICGRSIHLYKDMTPNMRASIVNAYEIRCGPEAHRKFFKALLESEKWLRENYVDDTPRLKHEHKPVQTYEPSGLPKKKKPLTPKRNDTLRVDEYKPGSLPKKNPNRYQRNFWKKEETSPTDKEAT